MARIIDCECGKWTTVEAVHESLGLVGSVECVCGRLNGVPLSHDDLPRFTLSEAFSSLSSSLRADLVRLDAIEAYIEEESTKPITEHTPLWRLNWS